MQLQAGYIFSGIISELIKSGYEETKINGLTKSLSYFEFHPSSPIIEKPANIDPVLAVANNIISRGIPTHISPYIEEIFAHHFNLTEKMIDDTGGISFPLNSSDSEFLQNFYKSLHIIDPESIKDNISGQYNRSWENLGSNYEEDFLYIHIPRIIHNIFSQILEPQRDIVSVIRFSSEIKEEVDRFLKGSIDNFKNQKIDFSLEFPYPINNKKGIAIEIDGSQHNTDSQKILDALRDDALLKANWYNTIRIKTEEFPNIENSINPLRELAGSDYFQILKANYEYSFYNSDEGLLVAQFALTPFAIGRIHKALIIAIINGWLRFEDKLWKIGIIERDVPCAALAIEDFKNMMKNLFLLEGKDRKLPEIELEIEHSSHFKDSALNRFGYSYKIPGNELDLLLDISMLKRESYKNTFRNKSRHYGIIRSSYSVKSERSFFTSNLIKYHQLIDYDYNESGLYNLEVIRSLRYFLELLFRKNTFRPGQIEILNRSLQLESVLGLLPTGAGKSLTYQLSALLQPGVTLIVDPIKSLMKDQYQGLKRQRMDNAVYINSSLKSAKERELAAKKMAEANVIFTFISPERLQIKNFRDSLTEMFEKYKNSFSYCVIDEAHCVSEWGHDFRTSYLRLGENAKRFCKIRSTEIKNIPLIGLTATASFDVLSDVQRELELDENAIIRSDSSDRPELIYKVWKLESTENTENEFENRKTLGELKQERLVDLIKNIPNEFEYHQGEILIDSKKQNIIIRDLNNDNFFFRINGKKKTGIIFCPHKTWLFGVKSIAARIQNDFDSLSIGTFMGASGEDEKENIQESEISELNQEKFINNEIDFLIATKAFGMGIDKPNIRFTIHFNYPSSIEAFYQEAGRAGRDNHLAICYILYAGHHYEQRLLESFYNNAFKGLDKEKTIIYELLSEINYSSEVSVSRLSDIIEEDYGLDLQINLWQKNGLSRLYINKSFQKGYGYIDLTTDTLYPDAQVFDVNESSKVLNSVKNEIEKLRRQDQSLRDWLIESTQKSPIPGIERQLSKLKVGEKLNPITVSFRNDKIRRITELLGGGFTERLVSKASDYCFTSEEFINNLKRLYKKEFGHIPNIPQNTVVHLRNLFIKIRGEQDTFKAIYRLAIIGIVDDYQIDYNSKTITLLEIRKKDDTEYVENLYKYVSKYVSKNRAENAKKEVYNYRGDSIMQKCLGYLIEFVYNEIAKKRYEAIISMGDACIQGAEKGPDEFREYLNLYFNSRYYPELRDKTAYGKEFSLDLVIEYIKTTDGKIDNLKHLRGACIRLLNENPDNATFLLLKAYTLFLLEYKNERFLMEAKEAYQKGFSILKENDKLTIDLFIKKMNIYNTLVISFNNDLLEILSLQANTLLLDHHTNWLTNFNKKFMENYGR